MYGSVYGHATFGLTIENTMTRTWFCWRLPGFDPTMAHVPGDPMQFIITVHSHDNEKPRKFCLRKRTSFDLDL
ncbi:hypothetical protein BS47DRAFT_1348343 [Hydnum rufescens UP504]|uniref:Uncharacterized protein n=1 Tax=Hydnum rufescens UP504 TaxID=1448309 RepID=A0A9P6AR59_9AGAM|nr:hypothetical protein BS47DRAFT_1348343 [Hydnum rufescens UP504]